MIRRYWVWSLLLTNCCSTPFFAAALCVQQPAQSSSQQQQQQQQPTYIAFYKPSGILCSFQSDEEVAKRKNRKPRSTLLEFHFPNGLHNVGRLDKDTEGLLLLTNNGQFTRTVCGPNPPSHTGRHDNSNTNINNKNDDYGNCNNLLQKRYLARVRGTPNETALEQMRRGGLWIQGVETRPPERVRVLPETETEELPKKLTLPRGREERLGKIEYSWLEIVLTEGRHRQVRRITADAGHSTVQLIRVSIGSLNLKELGLSPGEWCFISKEDVF